MPFVPFTKKTSGEPSGAPDASASVPASFSKKSSGKRRRKTGKVAPAQKALMSGRSMSGGGR